MSKFRDKEGSGGGRDERRRSRERAREAKRRRKELEKRAAMAKAEPRSEQHKRTKAKDVGAKTVKAAGGKVETDRPNREKRPTGNGRSRKGNVARSLPRELARRLSLPALWSRLAFIGRFIRRLGRLLAFISFWLLARIDAFGRRLVGLIARPTGRLVGWAGRAITPRRTAIVIVIAAAAAAIASQALDYRAVAIGEEAYAEVATLTEAPTTGHETPWQAHGPLIGLLAVIAAAGSLVGLRRSSSAPGGTSEAGVEARADSRTSGLLARQIAAGAAAAGLLIILGIDLPRAGDLDAAASEYAGTGRVLLKGFYIELCAMALLAFTALLPGLWRLSPALRIPTKRPSLRADERRSTT